MSNSVDGKRSNCPGRPIFRLALLMIALTGSPPVAAQQEGVPLAGTSVRIYGGDVLGQEAARKVALDSILLDAAGSWPADAAASDPSRIASPASTEYRYDDGTPEAFTRITGAHDQEYAQRFRLADAGTVASVTACFGREPDDDNADVSFVLTFYRDSGGRPGSPLAAYSATISGLARGRGTCGVVNRGDVTVQRLDGGDVWLGVQWRNSGGKGFAEDRNGPGGTKNFWRYRSSAEGPWSSWNAETAATAYFLRLSVDHEATPPPPASGCTPATTLLQFDGGYEVGMCYRTPDGEVGQAKSGIWASGQAGLLWFFDRGNAEVLVKVLDGCEHNGHRWVFVAPVTTLEFNLVVTAPDGETWRHGNAQGATAFARSDTQAFRCSE